MNRTSPFINRCKVYPILGTLLLLFLSNSLSSAEEATPLLKRITEKLRQGTELHFQMKTTKGSDLLYNTKGTMLLLGDSFRLRYDAFDVCFDGENLSYYNFKENTLTLLDSDTEYIREINPLLFVGENLEDYKVEKKSSANGSTINISPREPSKAQYQEILIIFPPSSNTPSQIEIKTKEGIHSLISLTKLKYRSDLKKNQFSQPISNYPSSEIIDLR